MHDLIQNNKVIKSKDFGKEKPPILSPKKGMVWLPRVIINPDYDPATQVKTFEETITETESRHEFVVRQKTKDEQADYNLQHITETRERLYELADAEYVKRSLEAAESVKKGNGKVRGGDAKGRLIALGIKADYQTDQTLKKAFVSVHDMLDCLKDFIEGSYQKALDKIDVADNKHW